MMQVFLEILRVRKRLIFFTAAVLVADLMIIGFISFYQMPRIAEMRNKVNGLQKTALEAGRGDQSDVYRQGTLDLEKLRERIPKRRHFARVLGEIMEAAASSGLSAGNVTYKPQTIKQENILAYSVSINVSGTYAAIKSFLSDLQDSRELTVIDGFSLANPDPFEEHVVMDLRMTVYLQEGA